MAKEKQEDPHVQITIRLPAAFVDQLETIATGDRQAAWCTKPCQVSLWSR
jgi:hypothetical protein